MSKLSRTKGRAFEQKIAVAFRTRFPGCTVRRSSQADRAHNPDVYFVDGPADLRALWCELTDARDPDPAAKISQAERDIKAARQMDGPPPPHRLPVCVWHRMRSREVHVTMRLRVLRWFTDRLSEESPSTYKRGDRLVTMLFADFLGILDNGVYNTRSVPRHPSDDDATFQEDGREEDARQDMKGDHRK